MKVNEDLIFLNSIMFKKYLKRKNNAIYIVRPALRCNLFVNLVMLRHEAPAGDETDASCLSMTVYLRLLLTKSISTSIGAMKQERE